MYIDSSTVRVNGRSYTRHLLRESFREGRKVKHRTVANLSQLSQAEIDAMKLAFKHKDKLYELGELDQGAVRTQQGLSIGAVIALYQTAKALGIIDALGVQQEGCLALWQVLARVIDQGSRLSAVRLASRHAACDIIGLNAFDEDDLYRNLDWLAEHQAEIEDRLFRSRHGDKADGLYLYDVTSSYFEGEHNQLAAFGYNRDKKRGKKQIVIGLLCDSKGVPVSIDVYKGNTQDTQTFGDQVKKVINRLGGGEITFVGDRGMIRGPQINALRTTEADNASNALHYISAISKPEIETLLKRTVLQLDLFDEKLAEVVAPTERYVLRRNPVRAEELQRTRECKLQVLRELVQTQNQYLKEHSKAKVEVALRPVKARIARLKLSDWVRVAVKGRELLLEVDEAALQTARRLDGCYVLRTDLTTDQASKQTVHERYKDLAKVEWAFRSSKTAHLEMRPIYLHREKRTRAHAFVVMLAYMIIKSLADRWHSLNITVEEGIKELCQLCATVIMVNQRPVINEIPIPRESSASLLAAAGVTLPAAIPSRNVIVSTKKKLQSERKV